MFTETLLDNKLLLIYAVLPAAVLIGYLLPYLIDPHGIRSNAVTGPLLARFSDSWLGWVAAKGNRSIAVHEVHKKYGQCFALWNTSLQLICVQGTSYVSRRTMFPSATRKLFTLSMATVMGR